MYKYANQLLASQAFFNRSTSVLEEGDSGFRPKNEMMTAAQQVAHVAQTIEWFLDGAKDPNGFNLDFEAHAHQLDGVNSIGSAREWLNSAYQKAVDFANQSSEEQLSKPLPPGPVMGGMPVSDVFWAMIEHAAHHRGALTVYSRALGKVPPMPYMG